MTCESSLRGIVAQDGFRERQTWSSRQFWESITCLFVKNGWFWKKNIIDQFPRIQWKSHFENLYIMQMPYFHIYVDLLEENTIITHDVVPRT
jgi:hypothetical protein